MMLATITNAASSSTMPTISRQVVGWRGVDGQLAEPIVVEDRLGDDRATHQAGEVEAGHRDQRGQRGAHAVLDQHLARREALGLRGAQVVLAHRLQHEGARHPDVAGHVEQRQRERRAAAGPDSQSPTPPSAMRDVLGDRHQLPLDGDELVEEEPDEERREGVEDQRDADDPAVDDACPSSGRPSPRRARRRRST